jgi:phytol kinase
MDDGALLARLGITLGLVVLVIVARHRTTLEDDSLAVGAFLCYVAWALMGWPWLVGPLVILLGYRWLSPPTPDNSRRMHDVPAVLSVWAPAVGWLAVAGASGNPELLFPYTVGFAAHLGIFGISRLAFQYRERPLGTIFARAVGASSLLVLIPYAAVTGPGARELVVALSGVPSIAVGAVMFMILMKRRIRDTPQSAGRWILQGLSAALATIAAWTFAQAVSAVFL